MRIDKKFGQRAVTKSSDEARKKYYLVFEGDETEVQYFNGIYENMEYLGINPLIEIRTVLRSFQR